MFPCDDADASEFIKQCKTFQSRTQAVLSLLELGITINVAEEHELWEVARLARGLYGNRSTWTLPAQAPPAVPQIAPGALTDRLRRRRAAPESRSDGRASAEA